MTVTQRTAKSSFGPRELASSATSSIKSEPRWDPTYPKSATSSVEKPFLNRSFIPVAGISHSYETYTAALADGNIVSGVLVSQTDEEVEIKNNEGITRRISQSDIDELVIQPLSLMPADLHQSLTEQELVDIVQYLSTLKKATP